MTVEQGARRSPGGRRHRRYRTEFKLPLVEACRAGDGSANGLADEHGRCHSLILIWAEPYRTGELTLDVQREEQLPESQQQIAALERKVGQLTLELEPALEHAVLAYALPWPTQGPQHLADQLALRRYGGWRLSATGAYKIRKRHGLRTRWERLARLEGAALVTTGLVTERSARVLAKARHIEAERPGDLVGLDRCYIGKLKGGGKLWPLPACDAAVRYGSAQVLRGTPRPRDAARFLAERVLPVYRRAGPRIGAVLTDGGLEWRAPFGATCRQAGIAHRRTLLRHAWTNGCVERLQGTILTELWRVVCRRTYFTRAGQLERALPRYLRFDNEARTHRGYRLQGKTPGSVFHGRTR